MRFIEICKTLTELGSISGTNAKIEFIKSHDDADLKEVYKWLYDSSRISGITEKKFEKKVSEKIILKKPIWADEDLSYIINYLDEFHTGDDSDIAFVQEMENIICSTDEEKDIFKKIVCKNLPIGIDAKTINKCFPRLISTFDVCLCDNGSN